MKKDEKSSINLDRHTCHTIDQLKQLIRFTPVTNKRPYLKQWQNNPKTLAYCENEIKNGKANGYGLITGNGLLAIDFDGANSHKIAKVIAHWLVEINTLAWTSGKPSRKQILVIIPSHRLKDFEKLSRKALTSFGDVEAVENEQLEIRYNRCQSVLPPSAHPETKGYYWLSESDIKIVELNDYQCNTILSALDTDTISNTKKYHGLNNTQQQLKLLESALEFIPSDNYFDWILVGMAIKDGGYDCSLWNNWSSNSTKYKIGECEKTWQSFNGTGTTIRTLFWLAKQHGFNQKQWYRDNLPPYRNTYNIRHNLDKTYDLESNEVNELDISKLIHDLVANLANPDISEAERKLQITQFCSNYRVPSIAIEKAVKAQLLFNDKEELIKEISPSLDYLLNIPKEQLNLEEIFGKEFANLLIKTAEKMPTHPDAMVTALLAGIASKIGTKSQVIVDENIDYIQPFVLRTMIVADSGQKKSPTLKLALKAIIDQEKENARIYKQQLNEYNDALNDYNQAKKGEKGELPREPLQKRLIVKDATYDGLIKAHLENPDGLLCLVDELKGYFKRMNKFAKGAIGDDVERDLELYNGQEIIKTRASKDNNVYLEKSAVSITGTIQNSAIEDIFSNKDDLQGITCRWLIWCGKMPDGYLQERTKPDQEYLRYMKDAFSALDSLSFTDLRLDDQAYELFMYWQHTMIDAMKLVDLPQVKLKYAKIEGEVARIAGILHWWYAVISPNRLTSNWLINTDTMMQAIKIGSYYLEHFAYITTKCQNQVIDGSLLLILEKLEEKGSLTANQAKRFIWKLREKPIVEVNEMMMSLVEAGKAKKVETKKGFKIENL